MHYSIPYVEKQQQKKPLTLVKEIIKYLIKTLFFHEVKKIKLGNSKAINYTQRTENTTIIFFLYDKNFTNLN